MYRSRANFSFSESKYFKGELYGEDEINPLLLHFFDKVEKEEVRIEGKQVETASIRKPKKRRKK